MFIIEDNCICCGACALDCSENAIKKDIDKFIINNEKCIECGDCYTICPVGAIKLIK